MLKFLKPLSFLPALFLMYMIYSFSAQDGTASAQLSYKVSHKIVEIGGEVIGADLQSWEVDRLADRFHIPVRKIAHMTEYFALAVAVAFPLYVYGLRGILLLLAAGMICVAFACGDEYHQAYVDGRGPSKRDVLIDSFGIFWGIVLVRIVGWTGRNTIFRPFRRRAAADGAGPGTFSASDDRSEYGPASGSRRNRRSRSDTDGAYNNGERRSWDDAYDSRERSSRGDAYDGTGSLFRDDAYDGRGSRFRGDAYDGRERSSRSDAYDSREPRFRNDAYDGRDSRFRDDAYDGREPRFRDDAYDGRDSRFRSDAYDGRDSRFRGDTYNGKDSRFRDSAYDSSGRRPQNGAYGSRDVSYYGNPPYDFPPDNDYDEDYDEDQAASSDYLSEDMSLRKLVSDLKDQKQTRHSARKAEPARTRPDA